MTRRLRLGVLGALLSESDVGIAGGTTLNDSENQKMKSKLQFAGTIVINGCEFKIIRSLGVVCYDVQLYD